MPRGVYQHKKGYKRSEETKRKISEINKRKHFSLKTEFKKGHKTSTEIRNKISKKLKGRKIPKESIKKRVEKRKINKTATKENHWNWKGGITSKNTIIRNSIETHLWCESVFARDDWTCQKCKKRNGTHHPHHIQNFAQYPELRFAIDNGITLCKNCHQWFHRIYGTKNNTKEQLEEFLKRCIKLPFLPTNHYFKGKTGQK